MLGTRDINDLIEILNDFSNLDTIGSKARCEIQYAIRSLHVIENEYLRTRLHSKKTYEKAYNIFLTALGHIPQHRQLCISEPIASRA